MNCIECKQPLRIISGGIKSDVDSTEVTTVHVFGCFNKNCSMVQKEQNRTSTVNPSFTE